MKRFLLLVASALTCGALSGYLIGNFPKGVALTAATTPAAVSTWSQVVESMQPKPGTLLARAWQAGDRLIERVQGTPASSKGLQLRESVVIVNGADAGSSLQPGTAVAYLGNEGRYLRVQHQQRVLTVPRSSVVRVN